MYNHIHDIFYGGYIFICFYVFRIDDGRPLSVRLSLVSVYLFISVNYVKSMGLYLYTYHS